MDNRNANDLKEKKAELLLKLDVMTKMFDFFVLFDERIKQQNKISDSDKKKLLSEWLYIAQKMGEHIEELESEYKELDPDYGSSDSSES